MSCCCGGGISRRRALTGAVVVGAGVPLLAACGSDGGDEAGGTAASPSLPPSGTDLTAAADVPVGGGQIFGEDNVVVTQPEQGTFRAFSATCTHAGCTVNDIEDGTIVCPCHLSKFSIEDGSVTGGPAPRPLPEVQVTVEGGRVTVA